MINSHKVVCPVNIKKLLHLICFGFSMFILLMILSGCFEKEINGKSYPNDIESIIVTDCDIKDYSVFNQFKNLKTLDLSQMEISPSDYDRIASQVNKEISVVWNVPVGNGRFLNTTKSLSLSQEMCISDASFVRYFHDLDKLYIAFDEVSPLLIDIVSSARSLRPEIELVCSTSVYGVTIDNQTDFLDMNQIDIKDLAPLDMALRIFPNVRTVEMCACRLDNETLAAFRDKYPDRKIVWLIILTNHLSRANRQYFYHAIRSDAQVFSTLNYQKYYDFTSEMASPIFRYCTEMRALDLGHNNLTDISEITNLKHLHTLILADNQITDISPLSQLKNLNYLEIQGNKITDAAPLGELPELEDLYMVSNKGIKNTPELVKCSKMKELCMSNCEVSAKDIHLLLKGLPSDCNFQYLGYFRWRRPDYTKNIEIRQVFSNWKKVKEYPSWDNVVYSEKSLY